jgi:hypothetical protein
VTLSTADQVRLKIQDAPLLSDRTFYGDGTAATFLLPHRNLQSATAYVPLGATAWTATGCTFDASGQVAFSGVISANSAFRLTYIYATFSDTEIGQFTAEGGTVIGASIIACESLMFDAAKRARWSSPDGTTYDDTQAMQHLREMYLLLQATQSQDAIDPGGHIGWGEGQGNW